MNYKFKFLLPILTLILVQCSKDPILNESKSILDEPISNQNIVAEFESLESFTNAINSFKKQGVYPKELRQITSLAKSMRLKSINSDAYIEDTLVVSDVFREFLNEKYEVIVGGLIFKVTNKGTIVTSVRNRKELNKVNLDGVSIDNIAHVKEAFGFLYEKGLYKLTDYDNLYIYDTFNIFSDANAWEVNMTAFKGMLKVASDPNDNDFKITSFRGTFLGKLIDSVLGFSKSERHSFDSKHRMDAKFYSVNYFVYAETGVKTKTQKKGWTGIWRKQNVSEIRSGYRVLILKESFDNPLITEPFTSVELQTAGYFNGLYYVGYGTTELKAGKFITYDYLDNVSEVFPSRKEISLDYDLIKSLIDSKSAYASLPAGYKGYAVRIVANVRNQKSARLCFVDLKKTVYNNDKCTYRVDSDFGFKLGYDQKSIDDAFKLGNFSPEEDKHRKLPYAEGTCMYGAARRGDKWKGVMFKF